jgi:hypothetical protein
MIGVKHPAFVFNELACGFLEEQGFFLLHEPGERLGRYGEGMAEYASERGLYLWVNFNPLDGNFADVHFGRLWIDDTGRRMLSGRFDALAARFGITLPSFYQLGWGPEIAQTAQRVFEDLRRAGSASLDLAWTAAGVFDGYFEQALGPWDVAGGALLVREAGGVVTDWSGDESAWLASGDIVAGPAAIHGALLELTRARY